MKPCLVWERARNSAGYGVVGAKDPAGRWRVVLVHRLVCHFFHGEAPTGKNDAMHSCDNRACYEPAHLAWGSRRENMQDAVRKGRVYHIPAQKGEAHPRRKLSNERVLEIRQQLAAGESQAQIAARAGISQSQVSKIKLRQAWPHIGDV